MNDNSLERRVLKRIEEMFVQEDIATIYRPEGEGDVPTDILSCLLTEVGPTSEEIMGEYMFIPTPPEVTEILYFSGVVTLAEEIDETYLPQIHQAINALNCMVPMGSFLLSGTVLAYRLNAPILAKIGEDAVVSTVDELVAGGLDIATQYASSLLQVARGVEELQTFVEAL